MNERYVMMAMGLMLMIATMANGRAFYGDPPDAHHPWALHDMNRPQPPVVAPASTPGGPPADATVLFDGTEAALANWHHLKPDEKRKKDWKVEDGHLVCVPGAGYLATKAEFRDCQVHLEWMVPEYVGGRSQGCGNSGVFLPGGVEVQILNNYRNVSYPDGCAGAVYGVMPPAVNALHPPGTWQRYDIIYRRPLAKNGKIVDQGHMTVLMNGVVVQVSAPLEGGGGHKKRSNPNKVFPDKGHIKIQDHGNPVRFRNIWVRALRPRPLDGGTDGCLSKAATQAVRVETAAKLREDAAGKTGLDKALRLLESLVYEHDETAWEQAADIIAAYVKSLQHASAEERKAKKSEILHLNYALKYIIKFGFIPADYPASAKLKAIVKAQGWKS